MPNSPLRQVVIDAIKARCLLITPANGFTNDLSGGNVFEWKGAEFDDTELPGINIMDGDEAPADATLGAPSMGQVWSKLPIMIAAAVKVPASGTTSAQVAAVARTLQADLARVIGYNDVQASGWGLANATSSITQVGIDLQTGDKTIAYAYVSFDVTYLHPRFNYNS